MNIQRFCTDNEKNCANIAIYDSNFSQMSWDFFKNVTITELEIYGEGQVSVNLNNKFFQKSLTNITRLLCMNFSLSNLTNLNTGIEKITLSNLSMRNIELHYFKKLIKLKYLSINFNVLNIIKNFTFEDLNKLEYLILTNNNIENIESNAFKGLYYLRVLDLNYNSILELHIDTFKIMVQSGNRLVKHITNINLRKNNLKVIKSRLFVFDHMYSIDLSYNQITKIENNAFYFETILYLNLQGNHLSSLDEYVFYTINIKSLLSISDNKIKCNCYLQWIGTHTKMWKYLNNTVNENITCYKDNQLLTHYIENVQCSRKGIFKISIYIYILTITIHFSL